MMPANSMNSARAGQHQALEAAVRLLVFLPGQFEATVIRSQYHDLFPPYFALPAPRSTALSFSMAAKEIFTKSALVAVCITFFSTS